MLKRYIWLTLLLYITLRTQQVYGSDEREHVHIKVHMPDVPRKHKQPHKVFKQQYKRPPALTPHAQRAQYHSRPTKAEAVLPAPVQAQTQKHSTIDLGYYTKDAGSGSHVAPYNPTRSPSVYVAADDADFANNYSPVVLDNDIMPDKQPVTALPPSIYTKYLTTQAPISKQLLHEFLTPNTMAGLAQSGGGGGTAEDSAAELIGDNMSALNDYFHKYATAMQQLQQVGQSTPSTAGLPAKYQRHAQQQQRYQHKRNKYTTQIIGDDYDQPMRHYQPYKHQHYHFNDNTKYNADDDVVDFEDASAENLSYSYTPTAGNTNYVDKEEDDSYAATQSRDYSDYNTMQEYVSPTSGTQFSKYAAKQSNWRAFVPPPPPPPQRQPKLTASQYSDTSLEDVPSIAKATAPRRHQKRHHSYRQQQHLQNYEKRAQRFPHRNQHDMDYF